MSLAALTLLLGHIAIDLVQNGHIIHEVDEGTAAHVWQKLMVAQMPVLTFFAIKWLRRAAR
jgi:hypothetical protein